MKFIFISVALVASDAVALFTRAWIEIADINRNSLYFAVALFTRAWIEIIINGGGMVPPPSRPLHEGVD